MILFNNEKLLADSILTAKTKSEVWGSATALASKMKNGDRLLADTLYERYLKDKVKAVQSKILGEIS